MQITSSKKLSSLDPILFEKYNSLTIREKKLVNLLIISAIIIFLFLTISTITEAFSNKSKKALRAKDQLFTLQESLVRFSSLKTRKDELTSRYLNSSMSYEQLTTHLDQLIKKQIQDAQYELTPSKDITEIGTEFIARKFSLSVKELSSSSLPMLLEALESGPPPLLLQRVEVSKINKEDQISLSIDLLTVEKYSADKIPIK